MSAFVQDHRADPHAVEVTCNSYSVKNLVPENIV